MRTALRYALPIVLGLGLLTLVTYFIVSATSRNWFEDDVRLRAELAMRGAREPLTLRWARGDREGVAKLLNDITSDERILAAVACKPDGTIFEETADFPPNFSCKKLTAATLQQGEPRAWNRVDHLASGGVYVSAFPIFSPTGAPLGAVALIHDMTFVEQRDATTRRAALWLFAAMSLGALLLSTGIARASLRRVRAELRALVSGETHRPEFQPLLRDVRELAAQLAAENRGPESGRAWTAERLREVLREHLRGERVMLLANREPYIHHRDEKGTAHVLHPASGLVTALEPVMRACSGVWVAHGSGNADREFSDRRGRVLVPPGEESYTIRRVWLTPEEERGYYYGFSNEGLWPLCHMAHTRPTFREADLEHYRRVNRRFADAVCDEVDREDPIVLVQD